MSPTRRGFIAALFAPLLAVVGAKVARAVPTEEVVGEVGVRHGFEFIEDDDPRRYRLDGPVPTWPRPYDGEPYKIDWQYQSSYTDKTAYGPNVTWYESGDPIEPTVWSYTADDFRTSHWSCRTTTLPLPEVGNSVHITHAANPDYNGIFTVTGVGSDGGMVLSS